MMDSSSPSYANPDPRAIAIIGMSISAPGGVLHGLDLEEFYAFLQDRGSGIIFVPSDRWNAEAFHGDGPGRICTTKGGFIPEFSSGDLQEFGISPKEASQVMTPQIVLLHQAFNALRRSGVDYRSTNTGVYVGCAPSSLPYQMDITQAGPYYMTGTSMSICANRINYVFDLLGPSIPVDTACSSSITAMHLAVQAIRNGECDQAIVAGVNFISGPLETAAFSQLGVLSPDGVSKAFDEDANGYARSDVASAVVIKRHDLAVADRNRIHATLTGTALTSCGSITGSLTTPSADAQIQAIRAAYKDAKLEPHQVDFVELHGTGTVVGDSLEANAAGSIFSRGRNSREIIIGSVKSNIGHCETGAYMSSLVKVVMMLERKQVLPNGYFKQPSSKINFSQYNLRVPVDIEPFLAGNPRLGLIASISSFGFGGACGHTVLREHEPRPAEEDHLALESGPFLFAVGGLSLRACGILVEGYKKACLDVPSLALSELLGNQARQMPWRTYAVASSLHSAAFPEAVIVPKRPNPIVICFSGQGPQHWQQGRQLFTSFSVFRERILECDAVYSRYTGNSFLAETGLFMPEPTPNHLASSTVWKPSITCISINFFQIALYDLLISIGLRPSAIIGHSVGETSALYASGAMPLDMTIKIAIARGRALDMTTNAGGSMVAISGCNETDIQSYIQAVISMIGETPGHENILELATYNSPLDFTVSGSERLIDRLIDLLHRWVPVADVRKLRVGTAPHSSMIDRCEPSYRAELLDIFNQYCDHGPFAPRVPTMSTVSAQFINAYSVDYIWENLRQPVYFSRAIPRLMDHLGATTTFLEISPHPVLSQYLKTMVVHDSLPCSRRPARTGTPTELPTLFDTLGKLMTYGVNSLNFSVLTASPTYQLNEVQYPFRQKVYPVGHKDPFSSTDLLPKQGPLNSLRLRISPELPEPWMAHHVIDQSNLIPAAVYIEMALEFPGVTQVWDCVFQKACALDEKAPPATLEISTSGKNWWVKSSSSLHSPEKDAKWARIGPQFDVLHACGKLGYTPPDTDGRNPTWVDIDEVLSRCTHSFSQDEVYAASASLAQFGPEFRRVNTVQLNEKEVISSICGDVNGKNATSYVFHPAIMDAVFQSTFGWTMLYDEVNVAGNLNRPFFVPRSLKRAFRNEHSSDPLNLPKEFQCYSVLTKWSVDGWVANCYVLGQRGQVLFTFEGLELLSIRQDHPRPTDRYVIHWQPISLPSTILSGIRCIKSPVNREDLVSQLHMLDQLSLHYIQQTLKSIPLHTKLMPQDRRHYIAWLQSKNDSTYSQPPIIDLASQENSSSRNLVEFTRRIGDAHTTVVANPMQAIELMFQDDLMDRVYDHPLFTSPIFQEFAEHIISLVLDARSAGKRVIRLLEVGAGTGKLTALLGSTLLQALLDRDIYVDYYCSDVSISLAQGAAGKSSLPLITPLAIDLDLPMNRQHTDQANFDIIVGLDVLHVATNIHKALTLLRELLVPGGHIGIIELDGESFATEAPGTLWLNFVFGSFQQWFGVLENDPLRSHCTMTLDGWKQALFEAEFTDILLEYTQSNQGAIPHISFFGQRPLLELGYPLATDVSPSISSPSLHPSSPDYPCPLLPPSSDSDLSPQLIWPPKCEIEVGLRPTPTPGIRKQDPTDRGIPPIGTIQREPPLTSWPSGLTLFSHYLAGDEIALVYHLRSLDVSRPFKLWLYTSTEPPNMALCGLVRTIRHEFPAWRIHLALFPPSWTCDRQSSFVQAFDGSPLSAEIEIKVDEEGTIYTPRIVAAYTPPTHERRGANSVEFNDKAVWRAFPMPLNAGDIEVTVSYINLSSVFPATEFSGVVTAVGPHVPDHVIQERIAGITHHHPGSTIIIPLSKVGILPPKVTLHTGAALVGRLTFLSALNNLIGLNAPKVLIHMGESFTLASALLRVLQHHGSDIMITYSGLPPAFLSSLSNVYASQDIELWTRKSRSWATDGIPCIVNFDHCHGVAEESTGLLAYHGNYVQVGGKLPSSLPSGRHYACIDLAEIVNNISVSLPDFGLTSVPDLIVDTCLEIYQFRNRDNAYSQAADRTGGAFPATAIILDLNSIEPDLSILKGGIVEGTRIFDPRKAYVIIGGIGGLGVQIANVIVQYGARYVVLTSRSGDKLFRQGKLIQEKKIVDYLRSIPGVTLRLEQVDCNDICRMSELFSSIDRQLSGVFFLPVVLNDRPFVQLDREEHWAIVSDAKAKALKNLLQVVKVDELDFLILGSSVGAIYGSPGQANYTAAQTHMDALAELIPNAVSIIIPPIIDGGMFARTLVQGAERTALDKYKSIGVVSRQVAEYCIDAIQSLNTRDKISLYIPSSNWKKIIELGVGYHHSLMRHLVRQDVSEVAAAPTERSMLVECATALSQDAKDISETVPLSSYGLDSLTSIRLSAILASKFGLNVSQLQLLGSHMTVERLNTLHNEQRMAMMKSTNKNEPGVAAALKSSHGAVDMEDTLVHLNTVQDGTPFFILHGAGGGVSVLLKLAVALRCPVYGIRDTPDTPINGSLSDLCRFYLQKIRQVQPGGPYNIGGFSFGTCLAVEIATTLKNNGDEVHTLVMLDGSPTISRFMETRLAESSLQKHIMDVVHDMATCDILEGAEEVVEQFEHHFHALANGSTGRPWVARFCTAYASHLWLGIRASREFLRQGAIGNVGDKWPSKRTILIRGVDGVGAKISPMGLSATFNLEQYAPNIELFEIPGTHFGMLNPRSGIADILNEVLGL